MTVKPCALRRKRQGPPARLSGHRNKAARWLPLELSGWVTVRVLVRTWTNEYSKLCQLFSSQVFVCGRYGFAAGASLGHFFPVDGDIQAVDVEADVFGGGEPLG